ncbi:MULTISPECIES: nuclear transport factor 2 family protein [unclassified Streptomyces]|uniref:nuclear transport factor 2 family protein n=1 Tax=unclassified Streptomyces TaxID=2593676 RepID=UPI00352CC02A|nr:nuclear transport factor 2 family protein [Streptomyces sp. NBC_00827]WUC55520.1 nuclear transport factor 2 family protein [Streptomyces sp. NBC_00554]
MPTPQDESGLENLHRQLRLLNDRLEVTQLCDRYVLHLDKDRAHDTWLDSIFTDDVHLTFPFGEFKGIDGLAAFQQMARTNFARTHHISANHTVDLDPDGNHARVRAHLMAVHVTQADEPAGHFDIGGHYEAEARRTPHGWRIHRFVFDLVWQSGQAPLAKTAH